MAEQDFVLLDHPIQDTGWAVRPAAAPAGHLISRKNAKGNYHYSLSGIKDLNKNERYISKSDRTVAERVALKEYAEKRILDARSEKFALDRYIASLRKDKRADRYLLKHPGAAELVLPQLPGKQDFIQAWIEADYRKSTIYPDELIYPTVIPGLLVRSKAEGDIISRLVHFGVPFRFSSIGYHLGRYADPAFSVVKSAGISAASCFRY